MLFFWLFCQSPISTLSTETYDNRGFPVYVLNPKLVSEKAMAPHSSTLAWKIPWMEEPGRRRLVGCGPWGLEELDTTEQLHFHFSFSCTGEGNGNSLQCSCLENPRDGGAWWAAVYGVAQSRTQLKRLSSSSSRGEGWSGGGIEQRLSKGTDFQF